MEHLCSLPFSPPEGSVLHALNADVTFMDARFPANSRLETRAHFDEVARCYRKRQEALSVIQTSMRGLAISGAQNKSLELLKSEKTLIVISGQQVGVYGGPVFTALKAAAAVQLAKKLSALHAEYQVVPVFWMEDNDHDVDEISLVDFVDHEQEASQLRLRWPGLRRRTMVSELEFGDSLGELERDWQALAYRGLHSQDTMEVLRTMYKPGVSPARAFRDWMQLLFAESGLLLVAASECRRAGLFAEITGRELAEPGASQLCMQPVLQEFETRGLTPQVQPSAINLFYVENGRRMKLDLDAERNWTAEGLPVEKQRIEASFAEDKTVLTPNVLLRPIIQDQIFPTLAYVAGPGERSYAAEIRELYARFDVPMPAFVARPQAALLSATFLRRKQQVPIEFADLRSDPDSFWQAVNQRWTSEEWLEFAEKFKVDLTDHYRELKQEIARIDASLEAIAEQEHSKSLDGLERLKSKVRRSTRRQHKDDLLRLRRMYAEYYPRGGPQDRHISAAFLTYRYGLQSFRSFVFGAAERWDAGEMIFGLSD